MNGIALENMTMRFGEKVALEDVSLRLEPERVYGLLGRNGAGKSTLLNAITGRIVPTRGSATIDGTQALDSDDAQSLIYAMGEPRYMPEETRVKELFSTTRMFYPGFDESYAQDLAGRFKLPLKKKIKDLSTGYGTIAKLIAALATDVPYVFLDEPVLGLDANHREMFYRELMANYSRKPRTFVLSTHLIEEIAGLIEHVIVLHEGRVLLNCAAEEAKAMGYSVSGKAEEVSAYCQDRQVLTRDSLGGLMTASLIGAPDDVPQGLSVTPLELQQLFIRLTQAQEERL